MSSNMVVFSIVTLITVVYAMFLVNDLLKVLATTIVGREDYSVRRYVLGAVWYHLVRRAFILLTIPAMLHFFLTKYPQTDDISLLGIIFPVVYGIAIWVYFLFPRNPEALVLELKQRKILPEGCEVVDRGYLKIVLNRFEGTRAMLITYLIVVVITVMMLYRALY